MEHDPPPPPPAPPPIDSESGSVNGPGDPPGKGAVFAQLLWRSLVLAIVGGAVIGFAVFAPYALFDDESSFSDAGLAAYIGAWVGLLLGLLSGIVLGIVGAIMLVPYPGRERTITIVRIAAIVTVAGFFLMLFMSALDEPIVWIVIAAALLGTALLSPWLIKWYVKRMEPTPGS